MPEGKVRSQLLLASIIPLGIVALLMLAFAVVPVQSSAKPDPESCDPAWVISKTRGQGEKQMVMTYEPEADGVWQAEVLNKGLRSLVLEVYDRTDGSVKILHQSIVFSKFGAYPSGTVMSDTCEMAQGSIYAIVSKGLGGSPGSSAVITSKFHSATPHAMMLNETFTSWDTLDSGWTMWNLTMGSFRSWFGVVEGQLVASNNGVLIYDDYTSYANWTRMVSYDGALKISFDIYLPLDCDEKYGWAGQVFWFVVYDTAGAPMIVSRFVMDSPWDTHELGWVYWAGPAATEICRFVGGWHHISYVLQKGSDIWTGVFDGVLYEGLAYSEPVSSSPDIGMVQFRNSLREEVQFVIVDNLVIEEGTVTTQA